ncbi:hypothetical protein, variant 3 [Aphanomyces astaci]|uniref:Uncharacterized protein n=1 Tax=Aphanomyces astaci TaxID=112090 RepID=W4H1L3_APHAT|nr:hypothetical protein, variant 3 [Aphanomyces astaci]ETV85792.1 hypothetical protein, variant 3 [Aphanomyces astaci]|eukprot:XP_009824265.1 hypothetical protein, variant 3 [Aphanomyces astaci]
MATKQPSFKHRVKPSHQFGPCAHICGHRPSGQLVLGRQRRHHAGRRTVGGLVPRGRGPVPPRRVLLAAASKAREPALSAATERVPSGGAAADRSQRPPSIRDDHARDAHVRPHGVHVSPLQGVLQLQPRDVSMAGHGQRCGSDPHQHESAPSVCRIASLTYVSLRSVVSCPIYIYIYIIPRRLVYTCIYIPGGNIYIYLCLSCEMMDVAPQQTKALALHDEIRLLVSPAKFLLLGYVVTNHEIPPPPHPPCHNVLGVLFAHPILNYSSLGLSLNNRDVHTMHTSMSTRLVKYMQMSELRVNETGLPVTFTPQPVDLAVEFASWDVLTDLVADGCQMLHVACAATSSALILEDGRGGAFSVDVDQLTRLFRGSAVQVVQISVYHNGCPTAHQLLLDAGVPYVVAVAPHTRVVPSSQLLCFSTNFYRALMSGKSIQTSFHLAKHSTRLPSDTFCLYAQSNGHHGMEVLYPLTDKPKATPTFRSVLRKGSLSFAVCKEFTHRLNEAHDICYRLLDPLHHTRFIDIHGPPGIGKTQLALAVTQYVSFRGTFDGGIRVLHVKDVVERKGAQHAVVWLQRIFMDIKDNSGRAKSFLVVLDGVEVFFHTPYHAVVVLDFVPAILNEMPNVTIVATTLQAVALSSSPSFKQFHVGLDSNPGGLFTVHFHALSSDSSLDDTTRLPHENYDTAHEPASPTNAVAAAAPANCCIM